MATTRDLPAGTVTFLFSDIEGSTRLLKQLGREQLRHLIISQHNVLLRDALYRGRNRDRPPGRRGFFFVFRSAGLRSRRPSGAARAWRPTVAGERKVVKVRMGIHTGEATVNGEGTPSGLRSTRLRG
jgi:class 3 adenylate cyclase